MMKFPIYGKIKNMFQSTNQKCTLTACQHVRTCPEAKELMRFQVDSHEKQQKWFDSNFPNNIGSWTIVTQIKKNVLMWLTTILMPIWFFYLLRGSVPPFFWATTHANSRAAPPWCCWLRHGSRRHRSVGAPRPGHKSISCWDVSSVPIGSMVLVYMLTFGVYGW